MCKGKTYVNDCLKLEKSKQSYTQGKYTFRYDRLTNICSTDVHVIVVVNREDSQRTLARCGYPATASE